MILAVHVLVRSVVQKNQVGDLGATVVEKLKSWIYDAKKTFV